METEPDLRELAEWSAEKNLREAIKLLIELDYTYDEIMSLASAATQDH